MKTIIVTGSNSGIGKEAALNLAKSGHRVLMLSRDSEKSEQALEEIRSQSNNNQVFLIKADLSSSQSIFSAVEQIKGDYKTVDVLINNAGVYKVKREENEDGIEMTFAVNFLAAYLLSELLLERLKTSGSGRIINIVSELYKSGSLDFSDLMLENGYKAGDAYANSKLAAVLYTEKLAKQTKDEGITVNALHPGVLATNSFRDYPGLFVKLLNIFLEDPKKGGERIAYLATSEEVATTSGKYFYKTEEQEIEYPGIGTETANELWQVAQELTGLDAVN